MPPSLVPTATREPSRDGANQSTALAASAASAPGSASVTGATPGSAAERRASRNCSAPAGRSTVNRWSPRRVASSTTGSCISATRRSCQRPRPATGVDDGAGGARSGRPPRRSPRGRHRPPASGRDRRRRCRGSGRRRPHAGSAGRDRAPSQRVGQPRPMFGRLPWFALERRMRALALLVLFDIGRPGYRWTGSIGPGRTAQCGVIPHRAACRGQPRGPLTRSSSSDSRRRASAASEVSGSSGSRSYGFSPLAVSASSMSPGCSIGSLLTPIDVPNRPALDPSSPCRYGRHAGIRARSVACRAKPVGNRVASR